MVNIDTLNGQVHLYVVHIMSKPQIINMLEYLPGEGHCNDGDCEEVYVESQDGVHLEGKCNCEEVNVDGEVEVGVDEVVVDGEGNCEEKVNVDGEAEVVVNEVVVEGVGLHEVEVEGYGLHEVVVEGEGRVRMRLLWRERVYMMFV